MKVKIMQRSVYHKYAEVEVEVPNDIKDEDVFDYLTHHSQMYEYKINVALDNAEYEDGSGEGEYEGMNEKGESEWRFDIVGKQYGGHL